ncbi:Sec1 family domain-containing protein 1 [Acipenser ruthenus]|uniref:Sec1 family domain-containing protein 1 n=1 Tax=Acipenser ruthenus TaxID=7906 RepID=A0A444UXG4_ACIRT|nr:Sec1 family domain-containing protein 1 [Acipenser ruthenus]
MLFNCVLYGPENIVPTLEDLADACAKQKVKKIEEALTQDELQTAIKEASEYLAVAGCLRPDWTLCDKEILMKDILNFHLITRMHVPIQSLLHSDRDPIPDVPAIYFVMPTEENIDRICQDLRNQLYESYYLNFISAISRSKLEDIASAALGANAVNQVTKSPLENVFNLYPPY